MCKHLGVKCAKPIAIKSDASAAIGICNRIGLGKVRHIEVNQLWLQEKSVGRKLNIEKVDGCLNLADHLTKFLDATKVQTNCERMTLDRRSDRHDATPRI